MCKKHYEINVNHAALYLQVYEKKEILMISNLFYPDRPPNTKERAAYAARLGRLDGAMGKQIEVSAENFLNYGSGGGALLNQGLRIRKSFSYLISPQGEFSDRRAPARNQRPSATHIASGKSCALRLYLLALSLTQKERKSGANGIRPPIKSEPDVQGWTDLIATDASNSHGRDSFIRSKDKRIASVRSAFKKLDEAKLVDVAGPEGKRDRYQKYFLLDEGGKQNKTLEPYKVPSVNDDIFILPPSFITKSWLHVLEDSEINLLLMIACRQGALNEEHVAMPAEVRLRNYGIARDPYSQACKTLASFGLIDVYEMGRHDDGRAIGGENYMLHRLSLNQDAFQENALPKVTKELKTQLARKT